MIISRMLKIASVVLRHRLDRALANADLPWPLRLLRWLLQRLPTPDANLAVSARLALEELGPVFVKFGQVLSTRRDLFDEGAAGNVWVELQKLQDRVPPFDGEQARQLIALALGSDFDTDFEDFSAMPIASASVAQVHTATLAQDKRKVVMKIIRPGIEKLIRADLGMMYFLARLLERHISDARRLHLIQVVEDYDKTIMGELNLLREAANTMKLRDNWQDSGKDSGKLYVPEVFPKYGRENLLVMEMVHGIGATDLQQLNELGVDLKKLAHLGVEIFFTQVFEDNFFHADMHPGNVLVDASDPANPTYIALDCAIIGSLTENDKTYLAKNLLAFFHRDYHEVANLHIQSGWVPADTDADEFASVIASVCDPMFHKPIKEISFGQVLLSLFQTARQFNMEVQPQLVLLQKTLINIEGMGRQIYPDLDLWETAAPFMERWMASRVGVASFIQRFTENAPRWLEMLPDLPDLALETMQEIKQLGEQSRTQAQMLPALRELQEVVAKQTKRSRYQRLGGAALIAALLSLLLPATGYADDMSGLIPGALLGSVGIYWMFVHG